MDEMLVEVLAGQRRVSRRRCVLHGRCPWHASGLERGCSRWRRRRAATVLHGRGEGDAGGGVGDGGRDLRGRSWPRPELGLRRGHGSRRARWGRERRSRTEMKGGGRRAEGRSPAWPSSEAGGLQREALNRAVMRRAA